MEAAHACTEKIVDGVLAGRVQGSAVHEPVGLDSAPRVQVMLGEPPLTSPYPELQTGAHVVPLGKGLEHWPEYVVLALS